MPDDAPSVSIAVPLYRSRRFVPHIVANIEAIDDPNVEIIVSDRHLEDDSLDALRRRLAGDPRVRFLEATDRVSWPQHYNDLLRAASGRYFMWLPHDDSVPGDFIPRLVAALEANPRAVLAFGRIVAVDEDGRPVSRIFHPPSFGRSRSWDATDSVRLLFWGGGIPFKGLFRRDHVLRRGLLLRPTLDSVAADTYWVFGLSLTGRLVFVSDSHYTKRFHATSTTSSLEVSGRHFADGLRVLRSYVRDHAADRQTRALATAGIVLWVHSRKARLLLKQLPEPVEPVIKRAILGLLPRWVRPGISRTPGQTLGEEEQLAARRKIPGGT